MIAVTDSPGKGHCSDRSTPGIQSQTRRRVCCGFHWWSSDTSTCCYWSWCTHRNLPLYKQIQIRLSLPNIVYWKETDWLRVLWLFKSIQIRGHYFHTVPEGGGLPVVVVMGEAGETRQATVVSFPLPLPLFPLFLPSSDLVIELSLAVQLLHGFSAEHTQHLDLYLRERLCNIQDPPEETSGFQTGTIIA